MARKAKVARKTNETDITVELDIDGSGDNGINTQIPFLSHMLSNMSRHGLIDLKVRAKGDIEVDYHHTVEDVGICLGEAIKKAVGDKKGIKRCGSSTVPMMDALASVVIDMGGRPYFRFNAPSPESFSLTHRIFTMNAPEEGLDINLVREFMTAFANSAGADLHVTLHYGNDLHHSIEAVFKALGRALREALCKDPRVKGVPSTKGKL